METPADLIDLALSVLSSASSLIQTEDIPDLYVVKGKLNLAVDNVKHMKGQVRLRLGEDVKCEGCGESVHPEDDTCLNCQEKQ